MELLLSSRSILCQPKPGAPNISVSVTAQVGMGPTNPHVYNNSNATMFDQHSLVQEVKLEVITGLANATAV